MYCLEKSTSTKNPSFSSTLLDKIYRSIEEGDSQHHQDKMSCSSGFETKKKLLCDQNVMCGGAAGEERISSVQRTGFKEKVKDTNAAAEKFGGGRERSRPELDRRSKYDNDHLFVSSTSSDSSSSGLSLSESESFRNGASAMSSCFLPPRPKPIRTKVTSHLQNKAGDALFRKQGNLHSLYDDYHDKENEECNFKSKSRALKIYAGFKKVKQPISPGVRLTKFINALFSNGHAKKSKSSSLIVGNDYVEAKSMPSSQPASTCSFSRSCLSKNSPSTRERLRDGFKRSVTFYPVSEIVGEHSRPCVRKCVYPEDPCRGDFMNLGSRTNFEELQRKKPSDYCDIEKEAGEDDEDAMSDSSSDLFELDHLAFPGDKSRYSQDLPVYETTNVTMNHVIARGLAS